MNHFGLSMTLLVILCSLNQAASEVYYITTNSTDHCTVPQPCVTLSQFAANSSQYLHSITILIFLPGTHYLSNVNLTLINVDNFAMKSENSTAQIKCMNDSHIHFSQSQCIRITNLEFIGCGGNQVKHVNEFVVENTKFKGQEKSGTALELIKTMAQIFNSTFISNRNGSYRKCPVYDPDEEDCFDINGSKDGYIGGAVIATNSTIDISQTRFESNEADYGGAIFAEQSSIINMSENTIFINNTARLGGGLLSYVNTTITINASIFQNNSVWAIGGVLSSYNYSTTTIKTSKFENNHANSAGVLYFSSSIAVIEASEFYDNTANFGGVLTSSSSIITIKGSEFDSNSATTSGGVLVSYNNTIIVGGSNFTKNSSPIGAVINAGDGTKIQYRNYLMIMNNTADNYAVIYLCDAEFSGNKSGNILFSNNFGSLLAISSNITFSSYAEFMNNQPLQTTSSNFQEGGAITLFQSNIFFDGKCNLEHNHAENGGAIHSTESKLYVYGNVTIAHNTVSRNGGGIYLSTTSELNCQQTSNFILFNNIAALRGGGLHAISSSVKATSRSNSRYCGTRIIFTKNTAKFGGGLSLEANAKLYILKYNYILSCDKNTNTAIFTGNSAEYHGGAVYVDDDTNSGTYASDPKIECFFQVLAVYESLPSTDKICTQSMYFSHNYANISGSNLYGGLLDRCAVSQFAEIYKKNSSNNIGGIGYFKNVSLVTDVSISSNPVRVCLCTDDINNCDHRSHKKCVKKGETFSVSLMAVDQVCKPVSAIIRTSLKFPDSGLAEGQLERNVSAQCTKLIFNVVSPHDLENLTLYASNGSCKNTELSIANVPIQFLNCSCLIGLQVSGINSTNCTCECHSNISQYMDHCNSRTGLLFKKPQSRAWISYINDTNITGYLLVYPNCPFDYCLSNNSDYKLNFNEPNGSGADVQCAFNRSSRLCGSCQPDLSLSLGSSRCLSCPSYWPALFIAITIAALLVGIALVTLLLVLNMTVAVGTLNGLIFYANVVYVNKGILLPFQETNFITVFIAWLNLELGIDTCYFPGMDTYIKTWLQLAFPAYVILLVVLVIIISSYSTKFSNLIGKKNPVATLATLILLSYAKLVEVSFKSLSVGTLEYPNNRKVLLWLPDATVKYLSGKHIPLFLMAVLILLVGLVYTALLFSWQWLLYLPKWRIFNWSRNPKIQTFIETYNTPYTPKHRYWTGLLLIARVPLYLIAASNISNNPTTALLSISFIVGSIIFLKGFTARRQYRTWSSDVLETFFHLNIFIFSWYSLGNEHNRQKAIAYTSVTITIILLLLIILYHVYTYTSLFSKVKRTKCGRRMDRLFTDTDPRPKPRVCHLTPPHDDDFHRFDDRDLLDDLDGPVNTGDYATAPLISPERMQPTYSVVEVHQPCHLVPPDPKGANVQNMPADSN